MSAHFSANSSQLVLCSLNLIFAVLFSARWHFRPWMVSLHSLGLVSSLHINSHYMRRQQTLTQFLIRKQFCTPTPIHKCFRLSNKAALKTCCLSKVRYKTWSAAEHPLWSEKVSKTQNHPWSAHCCCYLLLGHNLLAALWGRWNLNDTLPWNACRSAFSKPSS